MRSRPVVVKSSRNGVIALIRIHRLPPQTNRLRGDLASEMLSARETADRPQDEGKRRVLARRVALIILALLPGLYLFSLIVRYGVNVPYADEFTLAPLLVKAHEHAITFSDLFEQHNEHRYFFPRLLF